MIATADPMITETATTEIVMKATISMTITIAIKVILWMSACLLRISSAEEGDAQPCDALLACKRARRNLNHSLPLCDAEWPLQNLKIFHSEVAIICNLQRLYC